MYGDASKLENAVFGGEAWGRDYSNVTEQAIAELKDVTPYG